MEKIRRRMSTLRVGAPLDKTTDIGAIVAPVQLERIRRLVEQGIAEGATCCAVRSSDAQQGAVFSADAAQQRAPSSTVAQQEIFGPVLAAMTFPNPARGGGTCEQHGVRTGGNRVEREHQPGLANCCADQSGRCLGKLDQLVRRSLRLWWVSRKWIWARGRQGGLLEYLQPKWSAQPFDEPCCKNECACKVKERRCDLPPIDRTVKLYIGGKQARPDSGYSFEVRCAGRAIAWRSAAR